MADCEKEMCEALNSILDCVEMEEERSYVATSDLFKKLFDAYRAKASINENLDVDNSYVGLHLGSYEESDFYKLVNSFSKFERIHAKYALKIINDAMKLLKDLPNIRICEVKESNDDLIIVGDLHGNFRDLKYIIDKYGIPGEKYQFIFNGDFVDRGLQQSEVLLTLLYAFILYPERVFLNRGNHEDIAMNTNSQFNPNFLHDVRSKFGHFSSIVFESAETLFTHLPVGTIIENSADTRVFVVHGGISESTDLEFIKNNLVRAKFPKIASADRLGLHGVDAEAANQLSNILWSDPIVLRDDGKLRPRGVDNKFGCFANRQRGLGTVFGCDISQEFCEQNDLDFIIRSHEVRDNGYTQDHDRCFTIFSASNYQGHTNMAAVFYLAHDAKNVNPHKFKTTDSSSSNSTLGLIEKFKRILVRPELNLLNKFRENDREKSGCLSISKWAEIISNEFPDMDVNDVIAVKDYLCVCDDSTDTVQYETMFSNRKELNKEEYNVHLKSLFNIIDINHDNKISIAEARNALSLIDKNLFTSSDVGNQYMTLLERIDTNGDSVISFDEFKNAFENDS